jgi:hypothetical protein
MMDEYTVETFEADGLRVRVIADLYPDEPYDDGGSPIIRFHRDRTYGGFHAGQVIEITSYRVHDRIVDAVARWGNDNIEALTRYLRAFHGVTQVEWYTPHDGDYAYVSFDPADWREAMGLTSEYLAKHPDVTLANMDEWKAYCEGDTYGYVVEERVTWVKLDTATVPDFDTAREEWEVVDSRSGFYGIEYVTEEAKRVFEQECTERGIKVTA